MLRLKVLSVSNLYLVYKAGPTHKRAEGRWGRSRFCGTRTQQNQLPATHKRLSCRVNRTHLTRILKHAGRGRAHPRARPRLGSVNASLTKEGIERGAAGPNTREYPVNMFTKADYDSKGWQAPLSWELENMHRQTRYRILQFVHNRAL